MGKKHAPDLSTLTKKYKFIKGLERCSSQRHEDILYLTLIEGNTMEETAKELEINYKKIYGMRKAALQELGKEQNCTGAKDYLERLIREYIRVQRLKGLLPEYDQRGQSKRSIMKTIRELEERCRKKQEQILKVEVELYQDILYMKYVEGYSTADIAYDLKKTERTIYGEIKKAVAYFDKHHMGSTQ